MALIKLYESANPVTFQTGDVIGGLFNTSGWYMPRYDGATVIMSTGGIHRMYRDGTTVRMCAAHGLANVFGYDFSAGLLMTWGAGASTEWFYNDPISMKYDKSRVAPPTFNPLALPSFNAVVWEGHVYFTTGNTVWKRLLDGTAVSNFSTTGSITPRLADMVHFCPDGTMVEVDFTNGTYGVVRFHNMYTGLTLYESTFDAAQRVWVDTVNRNIWTVSVATNRMQVWSFQVAPQNFSAITMGANRRRYRQDDLSVTLRGGPANEPVPNWPVKWTMTTSEGHLRDEYTETNAVGVATNLYCGPGVDDYVGASLTIGVETAY